MKKRIWIFLLCAVLALLIVGAAAAETDPVKYTITWLDYDETVLAVTEVAEGEVPVYPGETPTREMDADYVYTFYGWDPEPVAATADTTYTAIYSATIRPDKCGDNLYWSFDESTGTLTITGSGEMTDFTFSDMPWYSIRSRITSVILPDELTRIGDYAFYNCSRLAGCTFPNGMISVGRNAFNNTGWWNSQTEGLVYLDKVLVGYKTVYPQTISVLEGTKVVADYAFQGCQTLEKIALPDSTLCIGKNAFFNCTDLKNVTIGDRVDVIGYGAFYGCSRIEELTMPCSSDIGLISFSGCSNITSLHFTPGTGDWTTSNYSYTPWYLSRENLEAIILDEGIRNIGVNAFAYCKGLSTITIPDSVTSIGNGAFKNCTGLTNITMSNNIINIGSDAFWSCSALTEITIPDKVKNIGGYAF